MNEWRTGAILVALMVWTTSCGGRVFASGKGNAGVDGGRDKSAAGDGGGSSDADGVEARNDDGGVDGTPGLAPVDAWLKASNAGAGDLFGHSVALDGDTLAVGAVAEGGEAGQFSHEVASGAVYVFVRVGDSWTEQARLKATNPSFMDGFGHSVALDGDRLVVGAPGEDGLAGGVDPNVDEDGPVGEETGAVYVFVRSGDTWSLEAYLKASEPASPDRFGSSVALEGDVLVVGAACKAVVFERSASMWEQRAELEAETPPTCLRDKITSVALSGDTVSVGIPNGGDAAADDGVAKGAVHVFVRSGSTWTEQARIEAPNADVGDHFGESVALLEDMLVVGASGEDSRAIGIGGDPADDTPEYDSGAAYVFARSGSAWTEQAYIKASNAERDDHFGHAVALSDETLVVSAPNEDGGTAGSDGTRSDEAATDSGAVYVFARSGTTWAQTAYVKAPRISAGDQLGYGVAIDGTTIAAGVRGNDSIAEDSGAAYVFDR